MPGEELVNGEELVDEQHKDTTELEIQGPGTGDGNGDEMDDMTPAATESATPAASMMFDPSMAGMPNMMGMMGPGADFNQMQMMMAMQNGMGMNAFPMGTYTTCIHVSLLTSSRNGWYANGSHGYAANDDERRLRCRHGHEYGHGDGHG